uniref:Si:ch211-245h14.1 n=1 Tax=Nothobranchius pienaari TaxID=704102 RepID=A0A1A8M4M7_9TELE
MSVLLRKLRRTDPTAASVLERADFCSDSEIQSLTREDLHELFPGPEKLKLRRRIFGVIHKRKPVAVLLKELHGSIPQDALRAALSNNRLLLDYLHILRDVKTQLNVVQSFLEAHLGLLEDISKAPLEQQRGRVDHDTPGDVYSYRAQVMYQMVISGKTFDAHLQLMAKVQALLQDKLQLISCCQGGQIIIMFCTITSQSGSDIHSALTRVTGNEPVILVLMHHTLEVKHTLLRRTWSHYSNIVLHVNVFYHEAAGGLLRCQENNAAVSWIQSRLLEYSLPRNRCSLSGECDGAVTDRGSHVDRSGSFRLFSSGSSSSSSTSSSDSCSKSIWGPGE